MNNRVKIVLLMVFYTPIALGIIAVIIMAPAQDPNWLEGWLFIIIIVVYIVLYLLYTLIKDPEMLMKRGKYTTDDPDTKSFPDKIFFILALVLLGAAVIIPGIEHANDVTPLPWFIELSGFAGLITGFVAVTYVNVVNRYASKGLVIHKDHELITSGPYSHVRHPLYTGAIIMCISIPVALGSFIATVVSLGWPFLLIYRMGIEEKMLIDHLPGYKEYKEKVKYRLVPRIY